MSSAFGGEVVEGVRVGDKVAGRVRLRFFYLVATRQLTHNYTYNHSKHIRLVT
jgi:hypothetical protein